MTVLVCRKGKRLTEDGFTTNTTDDAIKKLQAHQDDAQASVQLERDIQTHPEVQAAENIVELFLSNVDDGATQASALQALRSYFAAAKQPGAPGHNDMRRLSLEALTPEAAVLSFQKMAMYRDPKTGKTRCRGCATVEVPNDRVADFFCCASQHEQRGPGAHTRGIFAALEATRGINCAPPGRRARCVNIKRSNRRRANAGASDATMQRLEVTQMSVVDIDFAEVVDGVRARAGVQYRARQLWQSSVDDGGVDLKKRSIVLQQGTDGRISLQLCIDLRTIKDIHVLNTGSRGTSQLLALRLRRPPVLDTLQRRSVDTDNPLRALMDELRGLTEHPPKLERATDVSACEAFASPTAHVCLAFGTTRGFDAAQTVLKGFKIQRRRVLDVCMHGSRHQGACSGVSHHLPSTLQPLTSADFAAAGDTVHGVAFLLDLLLRHGHLRAADVPEVLVMLRDLCQWGELDSYSAYLAEAADNLPPFHRCNSGREVLERVRGLHFHGCRLRPGYAAMRGGAGAPSQPAHAAFHHPSHAASAAAEALGARVTQREPEDASPTSPTTPSTDDEAEDAESDEEEEVVAEEEEEGIMWPRRVIVTPLRELPYPSTPEVSNRIIRRYAKFEDRFLRVAFASESLGSISYLDLSPAVCERIRALLQDGLTVGLRRFVFLAFSNSQLRDHSCWMYCEDGRAADGAPSADAIRQSIGDLSALRTPAKFAARLGQAFSTTYETFRFNRVDICHIPDEVHGDGELYSDGVGVITRAGMQKVADLLPMRMRRRLTGTLPSAIQIRLGGCKGMLTLWDNMRGMRPGALVGVRPSMKKFESEDLAVEVCAVARPMPAAINRQLIMALLSLGIAGSIFKRKYDAHVRQLDQLLDGGEEGLGMLRAMGAYAAHSVHGVGVAQGSLPACMIEAGISPRDDIFLMSLCQAYRTFALKSVQEKCRMPLDQGVNLIGVMDESGTLPPGTFWASWDRNRGRPHPGNPTGDPEVHPLPPGTRTVVSRFPCLAPADVRVLRAADPSTLSPALTALTNVVVFSQHGTPEPCKMSGGDLDGDIYLLTWDPELIPRCEAEAVDYTPAKKPVDQLRPVQVPQIVDFFIDYMRNDQLGRIANGHLAIADFAVDASGKRVYADNTKCHKLVQLHSTAVDFAKTGVPVDPADVSAVVNGEEVPDYLGGTTLSTTVIGEIARDSKEKIAAAGDEVQLEGAEAAAGHRAADPDLLLPAGLLAGMMDDAEQLLYDWTVDICQLMRRYGAMDVGQVFAGRVREFHGRAAGREKQADHQKQLDTALAVLVQRCQRWWFPDIEPAETASALGSDVMSRTAASAVGHKSVASTLQAVAPGTQEELLCAASALYKAAYAVDRSRTTDEALIRRACPWRVAPRLLLQLKLYQQAQRGHAGDLWG